MAIAQFSTSAALLPQKNVPIGSVSQIMIVTWKQERIIETAYLVWLNKNNLFHGPDSLEHPSMEVGAATAITI